jgi:hypothetical protein
MFSNSLRHLLNSSEDDQQAKQLLQLWLQEYYGYAIVDDNVKYVIERKTYVEDSQDKHRR